MDIYSMIEMNTSRMIKEIGNSQDSKSYNED